MHQGISCSVVLKDEDNKLLPTLNSFYLNCIAPEIVCIQWEKCDFI